MNATWISKILGVGLFVVYIFVSCYGLYLIKAAPLIRSWSFVFGLVLYVMGALMWMIILRIFPLSIAFPIAAGALVIGTTLTGALFLSESLTTGQLAGASMILAGIIFMTIGK